jgi:uncharacterized protein involved in type VI secretion and phage assembly
MSSFNGVLRAVVIDNRDPENSGRVRVQFRQAGATAPQAGEAWAPVASLTRGAIWGRAFVPAVQDEVLLAFEGGDPRRPYVVGSLWKPGDAPPEAAGPDDGTTTLRFRNGVKVTLQDGPGSIEVTDGNGNSVTLGPGGVVVNASAKVTVNASQVEINAGMVNVNAGMSKFSGVVQCDTLISNSVVSASYSPGAGNLW